MSSSSRSRNWKNELQELLQENIYLFEFADMPKYKSKSKGEPHCLEWASKVIISGVFSDNQCSMKISMSSNRDGMIFRKKIDSEQDAAQNMFEMFLLKFNGIILKDDEDYV